MTRLYIDNILQLEVDKTFGIIFSSSSREVEPELFKEKDARRSECQSKSSSIKLVKVFFLLSPRV